MATRMVGPPVGRGWGIGRRVEQQPDGRLDPLPAVPSGDEGGVDLPLRVGRRVLSAHRPALLTKGSLLTGRHSGYDRRRGRTGDGMAGGNGIRMVARSSVIVFGSCTSAAPSRGRTAKPAGSRAARTCRSRRT